MIVKEIEVNKKVCPVMTLTGKNVGCVGKDCMAWRWYKKYEGTGYCGLAGKVEGGKVEQEAK